MIDPRCGLLPRPSSSRCPSCPRTKDTCGAASLAMVLRYWGAAVDPRRDRRGGRRAGPARASRARASRRSRGSTGSSPSPTRATSPAARVAREGPAARSWPCATGRGLHHDVVVMGFDDDGRRGRCTTPPRAATGGVRGADVREALERHAAHWTLLVLPAPMSASASAARSARLPSRAAARRSRRLRRRSWRGGAAPSATGSRADRAGSPRRASATEKRAAPGRSTRTRPGPRPSSSAAACASCEERYDEAAARPAAGARAPRRRLRARPAGGVAAPRGPDRRGARVVEPPGRPDARERRDHGPRAHEGPRWRGASCALARGRAARPRRPAREPAAARGDRGLRAGDAAPVPARRRTADLEVALLERHGLASSRAELAVTTLAQLADRRLGLRYANLGGTGAVRRRVLALRRGPARARPRPRLAAAVRPRREPAARGAARPAGVPLRGAGGAHEPRPRPGAAPRARRAAPWGRSGFSFRDREFSARDARPPCRGRSRARSSASSGGSSRGRGTTGSTPGCASSRAAPALGRRPVVRARRGLAALRVRAVGGAAEPERTLLVARVLFGAGTDAPAPRRGLRPGRRARSRPFPLRAHRQFEDGVAGCDAAGPVAGPRQRRVAAHARWSRGPVQLGAVGLLRRGRASRGLEADARWLPRRRGRPAARLSRNDRAHRLGLMGSADGANAWTLGVGQAF